MKINVFIILFLVIFNSSFSQTNPAILSWLQNTTVTARHYVSGNSTPINDASLVNVQSVKYSTNYVYATTTGLPSYITGPFLDGNPSLATAQNVIFKFPLFPVQNTGTATNTTGGNIGVFINGVALFDYRDGVSWKNSTGALAGGPIGGAGDGVWNRDAVVAEKGGFDCSKAHPAMGNYHHHQNPSAFKLDKVVISTICNLYNADGLYNIDSTAHSPLIGFAYDGFPIYGAYGYKNANGTGGIVRMKSSYSLRNITTRTTYSSGVSVTAGPTVSTTYPLGYFREDYQYNATSAATPDFLDDHNGRICVTPEYPAGIYCYFATVDANWNSAYPYVVGPTFYGTKVATTVTSITETTTTYTPTLAVNLLNFFGFSRKNYNELNWQTTSEINNNYFDVEKSIDGITYEKIGEVAGHGSSNINQFYNFLDNNIKTNINFYRLKQVDFNGKYNYSKVVKIGGNASIDEEVFTVFPNPSKDFAAVQIKDFARENYQVSLYDIKGKLIQNSTLYQGSTIVYFDLRRLYNGEYIIKLAKGSEVFAKKILVLKD